MKENQLKEVYLFDLDGTLTPAREKMQAVFANKFKFFVQNNIAYIASGSDYTKIKEQVPSYIIELFSGIYCSMGNELYIKNNLIYYNKFTPDKDLLNMLQYYRDTTKYKGKLYTNYIEIRKGMINFSVLGRDSSKEARNHYNKWDKIYKERVYIRKQLLQKYPQYDITLGGEISIDITLNGYGKEQIITHLRKKYKKEKIIFFGDKIEQGGNDYSIAQACVQDSNSKVVHVNGPEDCVTKLGI